MKWGSLSLWPAWIRWKKEVLLSGLSAVNPLQNKPGGFFPLTASSFPSVWPPFSSSPHSRTSRLPPVAPRYLQRCPDGAWGLLEPRRGTAAAAAGLCSAPSGRKGGCVQRGRQRVLWHFWGEWRTCRCFLLPRAAGIKKGTALVTLSTTKEGRMQIFIGIRYNSQQTTAIYSLLFMCVLRYGLYTDRTSPSVHNHISVMKLFNIHKLLLQKPLSLFTMKQRAGRVYKDRQRNFSQHPNINTAFHLLETTSTCLQTYLIKLLQDRTREHSDKLQGTWLTVVPSYLGLAKCLGENTGAHTVFSASGM